MKNHASVLLKKEKCINKGGKDMTFERLKKYLSLKTLLSLSDDALTAEQSTYITNECAAIESFINSIDDIEIRIIAEQYFIKGKTFEEIGATRHYDRRTVSRKLRQGVKVAHNARE